MVLEGGKKTPDMLKDHYREWLGPQTVGILSGQIMSDQNSCVDDHPLMAKPIQDQQPRIHKHCSHPRSSRHPRPQPPHQPQRPQRPVDVLVPLLLDGKQSLLGTLGGPVVGFLVPVAAPVAPVLLCTSHGIIGYSCDKQNWWVDRQQPGQPLPFREPNLAKHVRPSASSKRQGKQACRIQGQKSTPHFPKDVLPLSIFPFIAVATISTWEAGNPAMKY